jgi:hypothetical protein
MSLSPEHKSSGTEKTWLDHFERWFDIALRFGWVLFIYVVVTGNYIR